MSNNNQVETVVKMERDRLGQWGNGDNVIPSRTSGLERIRNPNLNKVSFVTQPLLHHVVMLTRSEDDPHHQVVQCCELLTGSPLDNLVYSWCDMRNEHMCVYVHYYFIIFRRDEPLIEYWAGLPQLDTKRFTEIDYYKKMKVTVVSNHFI